MILDQSKHWTAKVSEKSLLGVCLLIGVVGVTASKAMTVLVVLAGGAGFLAFLFNRKHPLNTFSAFNVSIALLFIWAGVSSFWSLNNGGALNLCFRLAVLCFAGGFLIHASKRLSPDTETLLQTTLLMGFGIGLLALSTGFAYAKMFDDSLWGGYYFDPLTTLNNGAVMLALLLLPVTILVWRRYHPFAAIILFAFVTGGLIFLSSGASLLAILTGTIVFGLVYFFGRRAGLIIAVLSAVLILSAPYMTDKFINSDITQELATNVPASAKHRLLMWEFVSNKISETPHLGLGMDSSRHIPQGEFRLSSNMEIMPLHPHNAALQIRLELGWPGVVIATALLLSLFWTILKEENSRQQMAIRISVLCAYLSVGAVSYGVWQSWWIATAWALAAIIQTTLPLDQSRNP